MTRELVVKKLRLKLVSLTLFMSCFGQTKVSPLHTFSRKEDEASPYVYIHNYIDCFSSMSLNFRIILILLLLSKFQGELVYKTNFVKISVKNKQKISHDCI